MPLFCKSGQGCYFRWQRRVSDELVLLDGMASRAQSALCFYHIMRRCRGVTKDVQLSEDVPRGPHGDSFGHRPSFEADPMGAVTAFRSCEVRWVRIEVGGTLRARQAGGAPAAAYRQGIHLMRHC